jgi:hypothetical protein
MPSHRDGMRFLLGSSKAALRLIPDTPPHFVCEFALQKINNGIPEGLSRADPLP